MTRLLFPHPRFSFSKISLALSVVLGSQLAYGAQPEAIAAFLAEKKAITATSEAVPNSVLVKFKSAASAAQRQQLLDATGGQEVRSFAMVPGLVHLHAPQGADKVIAALAHNPWVEYVEPDYVLRPVLVPNDSYFALEWGLHNSGQSINGVSGVADADIDMPEAWNTTTGGAGCAVAIIDTGTEWSHTDLDANIWSNSDEVLNGLDDDGNGLVDDVRGWDFFSDDNDPMDESGHGTHTAGTVAAEGNNGSGIAGVAWSCKLMPLRFLGPDGGATSDAVAALNYAVSKGIRVSNNSWGGGGYSTSLYNAIANAQSIGHIFVAAAGNSGVDADTTPMYPAAYDLDNIISVAATDNNDYLASFSNYGAVSVDLGAPGVNIASTYPGNSYVWMSGTSMAAPHVAGVVGLLVQQNPAASYGQIVDRVLTSVRLTAALAGLTATGGLLNAQSALATPIDSNPVNSAPEVSIISPVNGDEVTLGDSVLLAASARDEDGDLSSALQWSSSLDGDLGIGATIMVNGLSAGIHTISAAVEDSEGLVGTAQIVLTVVSDVVLVPPAAPSGFSAANGGRRTASLDWTDNSDNEDGFLIEREKLNRKGWSGATQLGMAADATSYVDSSGSGTFRYRIRAFNSAGDSAWSSWVEVSVTR